MMPLPTPSHLTAAPSTPRPGLPTRASVLEIIFFILGAPHVYIVLKRRRAQATHLSRYVKAALLAAAIAGLLELSIL